MITPYISSVDKHLVLPKKSFYFNRRFFSLLFKNVPHSHFLFLFPLQCSNAFISISYPVDANLLRNEMDILKTQGDQHALLVVEEIKTRSMSTQKLLEARLREEAELARRLALRNRCVCGSCCHSLFVFSD